MVTFPVVSQCSKKLEKLPKLENFGAVRNRGPDRRKGTALACAIGQSDSRIYDSGPLRSWKKRCYFDLGIISLAFF